MHLVSRIGRPAALVVGAILLLVCSTEAPAGAHVTVHPSKLPAGTADIELTFRVPNERDNASTVALQVFFPTKLPLLSVEVLPIPGWTSQVDNTRLKAPVQTDDGPVSEVVSDARWTATAGGISPGQYEDFSVSAGTAPTGAGQLVFKSVQTYSSGEIVRWIEVPSPQDPSPDSPAPVLTLTPARGEATSSGAASSGSSTIADALSIAALVLSACAVSGVVLVLGTARRRKST